ncbi:Putative epoxide hydrolase [Madurella fahalii]|uniref:Epoxide hydrolase n=1 Tax=Madurella fahalii TaxID=1157608 RepID=A0ABQ0G9H5_9PEZI
MADTAVSPLTDEVRPYKIHIPTKHLDLTRQKLELTRLPHEGSVPESTAAGTWHPKPVIEPLIDYWLDTYTWRAVESRLNTTLPQFRTAISLPGLQSPIRIHFIHARSPHPSAIPLLLIPPFPLTNLSLATDELLKVFTNPDPNPEQEETTQQSQAFHLIIPSLPGVGFTDPLPDPFLLSEGEGEGDGEGGTEDANRVIPAVAAALDTLVHDRLGYAHYLASGAAPPSSPGGAVDERIVRWLARHRSATCAGAHLISPSGLRAPSLFSKQGAGVGEWVRWVVARGLIREHGAGLGFGGYEGADFAALARGRKRRRARTRTRTGGAGLLAPVSEPNTLSYALCDSPVGMLAFVLRGLRLAGTAGTAAATAAAGRFTQEEVVTMTSLAWLPGPEGMLRFWSACARQREEETKARAKPKVAITVFTGVGGSGKGKQKETVASTDKQQQQVPGLFPTVEEVPSGREEYAPPAWANTLFDVVYTQRVPGPSSGLLAFEQPEVILTGVRGLAKELLARDSRLVPVASPEQVNTVPAPSAPSMSKTAAATRGSPARGASTTDPEGDKKDGATGEELAPPSPFKNPTSEGESPDTLVENRRL